jgi:hypothetical protein
MRVTEQLQKTEWAMVGSLGKESLTGIIPAYHRLQTPPEAVASLSAYNLRIRDAGLKTQNRDKGLDRFLRQPDPEEEMKTTTATTAGQYVSHSRNGGAVSLTQPTGCQMKRLSGLHSALGLPSNPAKRNIAQIQVSSFTQTSFPMCSRSTGIISRVMINIRTSGASRSTPSTT